MTLPSSLPGARRDREAVAKVEIGHTTIGGRTARGLAGAFLLAVALGPLVETPGVRARPAAGQTTAWAHLSELPREMRARAAEAAAAGAAGWGRIVAANRAALAAFSAFETGLEDESRLGRWLRPPAQAVMTRVLGAGNERVYPGVDGWLFYRPDVEYVSGRPLLDPRELRRRVAAADEWDAPPQPDPRAAIGRFARDLAVRGITLVVVPTPVKPGVHPEKLADRYEAGGAVLHNPSYTGLVDGLRADGVLIFEPFGAARARGGAPSYLETDTHWRPEVMEEVAERLGVFLRESAGLPPREDRLDHVIERIEVANRGDIERMLDLPEGASLYQPETVFLRRVLRPDGSLWHSSPDADVLVLGDSFSNIYSLESMGWGTSAGFVEHLSHALGRPLDRLVQNDQGAFATREMLRQQPRRLDGKRVIVWQFAERELSFGDWRVLPLGDPPTR